MIENKITNSNQVSIMQENMGQRSSQKGDNL